METRTIFRQSLYCIFATGLIIGVSAWAKRNRQTQRLGSKSAEYYRAGLSLLDRNYDSDRWLSMISRGKVPYHQLTEQDFRIVQQPVTNDAVYTTGFILYTAQSSFSEISQGRFKAFPIGVKIISGLDRSQCWRLSTMDDPSIYLSHEQGHLDITELGARTFASIIALTHPEGIGRTKAEAQKQLELAIQEIYENLGEEIRKEQIAYDQTTNSGRDVSKQRVASQTIARQLANAEIRSTWTSSHLLKGDFGGQIQ